MYRYILRGLRARLRMRLNRGLLLAAIGVPALLLSAGCGGGSGKYDNKMRVQHYGHDGYMGLTNTNPSLPNSPNSLTIKSDTDFIDRKLRSIAGVAATRTVIDGSRLVVTIDAKPGLSPAERAILKDKATAVVQHNMPRYNVRVNVTP